MNAHDDDPHPEGPSKSQRKRDSQALQDLGEALVALSPDRLARLELPDVLRSAVLEAQRIHKFGGLRRQKQYIGKLMRDLDAAPIQAQLDALEGHSRAQTAYLHRLERWRDRLLEDVFAVHHPEIHYSVYSVSERFRRKWLPKAVPAGEALDRLASWQRSTQKIVTLHHAYIAGENDAEGDVHAICDAVEERRLLVHVNVVRYNPFDPGRHGVEPPDEGVERNAGIYRTRLPHARVGVIPRVGFDVAASCGMFFGPAGPDARRTPLPVS